MDYHDHAAMAEHHHHMATNQAGEDLVEQASGTSMNPKSAAMQMIGLKTASWNMVDTQQYGPRGDDKSYSPNWFMSAAEHSLGAGSVMFQVMASLDPATITRRYPLLFKTGETAFGKPIVDGQHPHDLIMALGVQYARPSATTMFQLYFAPVGDPALGPVAFPHRASASYRKPRSGTTGRTRSIPGRRGSRSGQTRNWMGQVSLGRLAHPDALEPGDVVRSTASLQYSSGG
jgi:hypothetical protein